MAIGLVSIATGAAKIAGKIFQGVKVRREEKIEKKAAQLVDQRTKLASLNNLFNPDNEPWLGNSPGIVSGSNPVQSVVRRILNPQPAKPQPSAPLINPEAGSLAISGAANNLMDAKAGMIMPVSGSQQQNQGFNDPNKINPMLLIGGAFIVLLLFISKRGR